MVDRDETLSCFAGILAVLKVLHSYIVQLEVKMFIPARWNRSFVGEILFQIIAHCLGKSCLLSLTLLLSNFLLCLPLCQLLHFSKFKIAG